MLDLLSLNRFNKIEPLTFKLYSPPVALFGPLFERMYALSTEARKAVSDITTAVKVPHLPQDYPIAQSFVDSVYSEMDKILEKHGHDYFSAYEDLMAYKDKVSRMMAPPSQISRVIKNYDDFVKADATNRKLLEEGKITVAQYNGFLNYVDKFYKGALQDPQTGYAAIKLPAIVPYVNVDAIIDDQVAKIPTRKIDTYKFTYNSNTRAYEFKKESVHSKDPLEVAAVVEQSIADNPLLEQFIKQQALFSTGSDSTAVQDYISRYVKKQLPAATGTLERKIDYQVWPLPRPSVVGGSSGPTLSPPSPVSLGGVVNPTAPATGPANQPVIYVHRNFDELSKLSASDVYSYGLEDRASRLLMSQLKDRHSVLGTSTALPTKEVKRAVPMSEILTGNNPSVYGGAYNIPLIRAIQKYYPNLPENKKWELYNEYLRKNTFSTAVNVLNFNTTEAQEDSLKSFISSIGLWRSLPIIELDLRNGSTRTIEGGNERDKLIKAISDTHRADKSRVNIAGVSLPTHANVPLGFYVNVDFTDLDKKDSRTTTESKTYIFPFTQNNVNRFNFGQDHSNPSDNTILSSMRYNLFGFYAEGREMGAPVTITLDGNPMTIIGRLEYVADSNNQLTPVVRYYRVTDPKNIQFTSANLLSYKGKPLSPEALSAAIVQPLIQQNIPYKARTAISTGNNVLELINLLSVH